jgi:ADP-ribose pyrophosphatase
VKEGPNRSPVWTILEDETVFEAKPFVRVTRQRVITCQGKEVPDYYQVGLPDFVLVWALTPSEDVITLWQYKHGGRSYGLTFPAGEIAGDEPIEAAARRELMEETGYRASEVQVLGKYAVNGNQGCGHAYLCTAKGCVQVAEPRSGDLERMDLKLMSIADVDAAVRGGEISVLPHLALWGSVRT